MEEREKLFNDFTSFVSQLSPAECREQLVLAYIQMEKCINVLKGNEDNPETLKDNGRSSDLELFYRCKKMSSDLKYLKGKVSEKEHDLPSKEVIGRLIKFASDKKRLKPCGTQLNQGMQLMSFINADVVMYGFRTDIPKFAKNDKVWYMYGNKMQHSGVGYVKYDKDGSVIYHTYAGHDTAESETFSTMDELIENLKSVRNEEE